MSVCVFGSAFFIFDFPGCAKRNDDAELVSLSDKHGNKLTLDKDGVTIVSAKDFKVDASGKVEIMGSKVDLK